MKRAALSFGAMFAVLLAVALSVPVGPPDTRGYVPTLLQWGAPLVVALVVLLVVLLTVTKLLLASLKDRRHERQTLERLFLQQNQSFQSGLQLMAHVTAQQAALVQQSLQLGARLIEERGQYYAQLPGGSSFPLEVAEAEYWEELTAPALPASNRQSKIVNRQSKGGW